MNFWGWSREHLKTQDWTIKIPKYLISATQLAVIDASDMRGGGDSKRMVSQSMHTARFLYITSHVRSNSTSQLTDYEVRRQRVLTAECHRHKNNVNTTLV